jgi:membrane-associated phospholipid phosphatase
MPKDLKIWSLTFAATILACFLSVLFVDRAVATYVHEHMHRQDIFDAAIHLPEPFLPAALGVLMIAGIAALGRWRLPHIGVALVLGAASVVWVAGLKGALKIIFGRRWPENIHNNAALFPDGVYQFDFFGGWEGANSFPSGHTAVMAAIATMAVLRYPRLWPLSLLAVLAVAISLVAINAHFVADVIAGGFIGYTTSLMTDRAYRLITDDRERQV